MEHDGDVKEHRCASNLGVLVRGADDDWLHGLQHKVALVEDSVAVGLVDEEVREVPRAAEPQRAAGVRGQEPRHLRDVGRAPVGALEVVRALRVHEEEPPEVDDREELVVRPLLQLHVDHLLLAVPELGAHDIRLQLCDRVLQVYQLGGVHSQALLHLLVELQDLVLQRVVLPVLEGHDRHDREHRRDRLRGLRGRGGAPRGGAAPRPLATPVLYDELPDLVNVRLVDLLTGAERLSNLHRVLTTTEWKPPHAQRCTHVHIKNEVVLASGEDAVALVELLLVLLPHDLADLIPGPGARIP
mmetsp:Transcript_69490/g.216982  ORF Transcript_69490/g.216982 Transcript_69490/m.216982 type:complete len:300 (+) Transcript_69490:360-1259(+)